MLFLARDYAPSMPVHWLELLTFTIIGSLFPDVDTKSKGQQLVYAISFLLVIALIAQGSDAATTIVIKDGTAVRYSPVVAVTALAGFIFSHQPVAFRNLITTVTGTCSYSITYYPRP